VHDEKWDGCEPSGGYSQSAGCTPRCLNSRQLT
jgi:hypothetical protein